MGSIVKILLVILAFLGLTAWALYQTLVAWDARGVLNHVETYTAFLEDAAATACIEQPALQNTADVRDWRTSTDVGIHYDEPEEWATSLYIDISPPMPFAKLPGRMFYFDAEGCLIP